MTTVVMGILTGIQPRILNPTSEKEGEKFGLQLYLCIRSKKRWFYTSIIEQQ